MTLKNRKTKKKMPKKKRREARRFDKIFREISGRTMITLVSEKNGIKIEKVRRKKTNMLTTKEREIDACYFITTKKKAELIMHMEYQSSNDPNMIYRMLEYYAMLLKRNPGKTIKCTVIYVGKEKMNMRTQLHEHEIFRGFTLIDANTFDYKKLLATKDPKTIVHAILGNYPKDQAKEVVHQIIDKLKKHTKTQAELIQRCYQLQVFSLLRNLGGEVSKILKSMPVTIDLAKTKYGKDLLKKERATTIINLLRIGTLSVEQIAQATNASIKFVEKMKRKIS